MYEAKKPVVSFHKIVDRNEFQLGLGKWWQAQRTNLCLAVEIPTAHLAPWPTTTDLWASHFTVLNTPNSKRFCPRHSMCLKQSVMMSLPPWQAEIIRFYQDKTRIPRTLLYMHRLLRKEVEFRF